MGAQTGAFDVTITFTETVLGFLQSELSLTSNTAEASITDWDVSEDNTTYTATITAEIGGEVTLSVAAGVAIDAGSNLNTAATSQTVTTQDWMPDVNLRTAIRKRLHLRDDEVLTQAKMPELTTLIVLSRQIQIENLTGLEYATNLTALYLASNSISDVSHLSGLASLTDLWLSDNPLLDMSPLYDLLSANGGEITYIDIEVSKYAPWDVNKDESVDASDVALVTAALEQAGANILNPRTDVNGDGVVDADDLTLVNDNLDADDEAAPAAMSGIATLLDPEGLESLDPETLAAQLSMLRSKSDGSLKYQRAIALLESTLAALRPAETLLLANYPNPFNPETWIPYHLSNPSEVRLTIYDMHGTVVRRLDLGHQREGYYTSRSRAAYWDGKNETGERVASGMYFYQLEADNTSLLRKMVILK